MSLRGRRVLVGILAGIDLVALMYSGDAIYLWILIFIGLLLLLGFMQALWTLRSFVLWLELPEGRVTSGESVSIGLKMLVDLILPPAHLAIQFDTADPESRTLPLYVSPIPGKTTLKGVEFDCPYRGEYEIGVRAVEATDLFGLVRLRREGEKLTGVTSRLAVYPRTFPIITRLLDLRMNEGAEDGARTDAEELSSIADLRGWREGDSLKRVHWKLSARTGTLVVKEFDGSFDAKNMVFLDASIPPAPTQQSGKKSKKSRKSAEETAVQPDIRRLDLEETMTSVAASFCELFCSQGRRVQLISYGSRREETDSVEGGFSALHLALARVQFGDALDAAGAIDLECSTHGVPDSLVLVTANLSGDLIRTLCALGTRGARVTVAACCPREEANRARDELSRHGVRLILSDDLVFIPTDRDEDEEGGGQL